MTLSTPAQFITSIRNHSIEPTVFCTHLLHRGVANDRCVRITQTATEFDIDRGAAARLHRLAAEFNLVSYPNGQTDPVQVNQQQVMEFIQFIDRFGDYATSRELKLLADSGIHDVDLYVAVPELFEGRAADLLARLTRLVRNAETELLVVTPFFTRFGVEGFVDHLAQATSRGVSVTILTRDATGDGNNVEYIETIRETITETGNGGNLEVLEYASQQGRLHAKALIADTERAYVGSANLTNYSLKEAIEIGLIVEGPAVSELSDFFETVRASSDTRRL